MILPANPALWPVGDYDIIYADPPWPYKDKAMQRGGAERHYRTMSLEEICALPVDRLAAARSALALWGTFPNLWMVKAVMEAWGFTYKTGLYTWVKTNEDGTIFRGMGHYTRANAEPCFVGIKGRGLKRLCKSIPNTQMHPRGLHSAKPDGFRTDLERLYGPVRRVELFAREEHLGWDSWGDGLSGPPVHPGSRIEADVRRARGEVV